MQQILTEEGYQRLEIEASRYNDICTILKKLKENGFFKALYDLTFCIFASEHDFTVKMLSQMQKQKKSEGFKFNELYRINSGIFCNNFQLINKIIIDDIFMQFTSKVCTQLEDYEEQKLNNNNQVQSEPNSLLNKSPPQSNIPNSTSQQFPPQSQTQPFLQNNYVQDQLSQQQQLLIQQQAAQSMAINNLNQNLNYIMTYHPEIDVAIQTAQSQKKTPRTNSQHSLQKQPINNMEGTAATFNPQSPNYNRQNNSIHNNNNHSQSVQDIPNHNKNQSDIYQSDDHQVQLNSSLNGARQNYSSLQQQPQQQNHSQSTSSINPRFYQQNLLNNTMKYSHSPPNNARTLHNTNYSLNKQNSLLNSAQLNLPQSSQLPVQVQQFNSPSSQSNNVMNNSIAYSSTGRKQSSQQYPQPNNNNYAQTSPSEQMYSSVMNNKVYLPYSEFSYTKGGTFTKSQRKLHDIQNNPGVGQYESGHKKSSSSVPFNRQEKKTIFEKKSDYQGTLYYPSHHFLAKSPTALHSQ